MMTFASRYYSLRRQSGAASTAIAVLFLLILVAAVLAVTNLSGSSVVDAARQEQQTAALFLAESGVEAATATLNKENKAGNYGHTTCEGLAPSAEKTLGRGNFQITSAACVGDPSTCPECNVVVTGTINNTTVKRIIRTKIAVFSSGGTSKCDANPILTLTSKELGEGIFTNLAYRARDDGSMCGPGGGSNALIQTCDIVSSNDPANTHPCTPDTEGWNLQRTGTNNVSGLGVFSNINLDPGSYTISQTLVDTSTHNPALRNYVGVGLLVEPDGTFQVAPPGSPPGSPLKDTVGFVGSYGRDTGTNKTTGTSSGPATGAIADGWNCAVTSGSATWDNAADANLLLYGFSSWPEATASAASSMILGGSLPLRRFATFANEAGSFPDNMYSHIWYSWNSAYAPSGATARNGATFTGAVGASVTGSIAGNTLTVAYGKKDFGELRVGDAIAGTGVVPGTKIVSCNPPGTCTGTGTAGTYTVDGNPQIVKSTTMTVSSRILRVSAVASGQFITVGDIVASGITEQPTVTAIVGGGTSPGEYALDPLGPAVSPVNTTTMQSSGTTIRLSGTIPAAPPAVGTVLRVVSGSGAFDSTAVTDPNSQISGTTLTFNSCSLVPGDVVFGTNIKPPTRIISFDSCAGGTGTYTVSNSQTAASGLVYARAAVTGTPTSSEFTVSRRPAAPLVNAQICGGVCAMLKHGSATQFELATTGASDDWASGFVCAKGADADKIRTLGIPIVKRASWSEPVQ